MHDEEGGYEGFPLQGGQHAVHMHGQPVDQAAKKAGPGRKGRLCNLSWPCTLTYISSGKLVIFSLKKHCPIGTTCSYKLESTCSPACLAPRTIQTSTRMPCPIGGHAVLHHALESISGRGQTLSCSYWRRRVNRGGQATWRSVEGNRDPRRAPSRAPNPPRMGSMEKRPPVPAMLPIMSGAARTPGYSSVVRSMREAISPARKVFRHTCRGHKF